jgi:hypothetical protein
MRAPVHEESREFRAACHNLGVDPASPSKRL